MSLNIPKLKNAIIYIAGHKNVSNLGITKVYKLLYFADVTHLRDVGQTITGSEYVKYQHGPVPSRGEKLLKQMRHEKLIETEKQSYADYVLNKIIPLVPVDRSVFDADEVATLDRICERYGAVSAAELSELSHEEPAWELAPMLGKLSPELLMYGAHEEPDGL